MTDLLSEDELAGLKALGDVAATKDQLLSAIEAGAYQADITRFERAIWQLFDRARAVRVLLAENNNLRAHIDALKAERWEPIETAPKDGTPIIAYCVHTNAKYATNSIQEGWEYPVIAKWIDHNGGGWTWHGMAGTFTHWRPLPAPPSSLLQR